MELISIRWHVAGRDEEDFWVKQLEIDGEFMPRPLPGDTAPEIDPETYGHLPKEED